jgi:hypothetical protein
MSDDPELVAGLILQTTRPAMTGTEPPITQPDGRGRVSSG